METSLTGACHFCGQIKMITMTGEEWEQKEKELNLSGHELADWMAAEKCDCRIGSDWRTGRIILGKCAENIEAMFRENHPEIADLLQEAKEPIWEKVIRKISITTHEDGTASMNRSKGNIEIQFAKKKVSKVTVSEK